MHTEIIAPSTPLPQGAQPTEGQLDEQRHQYLDLDPDSVCRPNGFTCSVMPAHRPAAGGAA